MWGASPVVLEKIGDVTAYRTTDPEVMVVEQVVTGTMGPGGPPVRIPGLLVLRIRDGKIVHCRDYMDPLALTDVRPAA